ncbi:MAG: hypothetical protein VSS75_012495 [Candidatus Parabeggiatoa sp.]|nr:hypothetical protein [Candidatus Parabeggiatoa sp.]
MRQEFSYTADAIYGVADKLGSALDKTTKSIEPNRVKKFQEIQKRIDDLKSRGLLKKQEYVSFSTSDFERRYYNQRSLC